ncbi:MAG: hypothetical protein F4057_02990 [Acidobacteria bacterium]|nr:hypothetical protein [Acidobacteriota bacterium]
MHRNSGTVGPLAAAVVVAALLPTAALAQDTAAPRTAWGAPDLQGVWDYRSLTPMERPADLADTAVFSEEEAVEFAAETLRRRSRDNDTTSPLVPYNDFWFEEGTSVNTARTSLIVDPPDGRIPPLTDAAQKRLIARRQARASVTRHEPTPGGWVEDLGSGMFAVRCILGFNSGPPMTPAGYNQNLQLFQTEDHVVLYTEMVHSARIVPLDGRDHVDPDIRQWMGDSRGYWDGDTLVVETVNFLRETSFRNGLSDANLRLTERFTRASDSTLLYEVTVDDPTAWIKPWTYQIPMQKSDLPLYEYACHEGNYGLYNILVVAREREAAEEAARAAAQQSSR